MKKKYSISFILFILMGLFMFLAAVYLNHKTKLKCLSYHFNGKVDSVSYSIKGQASIKVNGVFYDLNYPDWDFDHYRIVKGDSIVKYNNSIVIKLIKPNGQIVVEGE